MHKLNTFRVLVILSVVTIVSCFKPPEYCDKKYSDKCTVSGFGHVGCSSASRKLEEPKKLSKNDRVSLTKYFNDIRNNLAYTINVTNMKELIWNEEYEHLAERSIEKLPFRQYSCAWTENSRVVPQELHIAKSANNFNGTWRINRHTMVSGNPDWIFKPPMVSDLEFSKMDKMKYMLDEEEDDIITIHFPLIHDPIANLIGCSWAHQHNQSSDNDFQQIRCFINSRKNFTSSEYINGKPCSKCEPKSKCSKDFKYLCSSSDKFSINFALMVCVILLGFAKYFK